jgi:hypothetical protein
VELATMQANQAPTLRRGRPAIARKTRDGVDAPLVLGRYQLYRRLGSGAFGTVWEARDQRLDRDVAVKLLARERIVGGRFEREARAAARLAHPAIVTLYEAGADDDGAYLVSELVRGATLDTLQAQGRLSDRDILKIGIALCDALSHAHAAGVVHRDVKPSNILVPDKPVTPAHPAKLTDFGVAHVVGGDSLTRTGDVVGTAAYMAPEQAAGRDAGAPADLYALALVLYEALTGLNPVRAGTAAQQARRLGAHLPPLRRQRRELPRELGCAIDLALRPKPRERGTVGELRAALAGSLPGVCDTPGIVGTAWRRTRTTVAPGRGPSAAGTTEPHFETEEQPLVRSERPAWPERALGAATAAGLAVWAASQLLSATSIAPAALALVAGGLTLVLPRIGWLALAAVIAALAAGQHHAGASLAVLAAAVIPILLMPRARTGWPLPAVAAALGSLGLAAAWPALAARAPSMWRRAALGAAGWLWVALTAAGVRIAHRPPAPAWTASPGQALHHVIVPIVTSGMWVGGVVWALAALTAPYLVSERRPAVDVVRVVVWAAALASATSTLPGVTMRPAALAGVAIGAATLLVGSLVAHLRERESFSPVP